MPRSPSLASASYWSCSAPPSRPGPLRRAPTAHVDLHTHSTASDGEFPPDEVARRAQRAGLVAFALTDHDTTAGVRAAADAGAVRGIRAVGAGLSRVRARRGRLPVPG